MARIPRWTMALAAVVLGAALVATAVAQPPGGGGGRGGRGGWGGGMGMRQGGAMATLNLLRNEAVQKEIKLTAEQLNQVKDIEKDMQEMWKGMAPGGGQGGRGNWRDMSEEERKAQREKFEAERKKNETKMKEIEQQVEDVLDEGQLKRIKQIAMQQRLAFPGALARDEELAKQLGLSPEQTEKIRKVADSMRPGRGEDARGNRGGGNRGDWRNMSTEERDKRFAEMRKQMEERSKEMTTKILEVLTAEQKAKLEELKGQPFDLTKLRPAFGAPGPGGPGGGRGAGAPQTM